MKTDIHSIEAQVLREASRTQQEILRAAKMMTVSDASHRQFLWETVNHLFERLRQLSGLTTAAGSELLAFDRALADYENGFRNLLIPRAPNLSTRGACTICGRNTIVQSADGDRNSFCSECISPFREPRLLIDLFFTLWAIQSESAKESVFTQN